MFYVWSHPKTIVGISVILVGIAGLSQMGCDPVTRHKVLTFFFDGVPPLGGVEVEIAPTAIENTKPAAGAETAPGTTVARKGSRHKPAKDCTRCHLEKSRWARKQFFKPLPQLCYECHTNYAAAQAVVHGPVAVGACVFCHSPHQSDYPKLLKVKEPELCYQCHDRENIAAISAHQNNPTEICTKCHDPHVSSEKKLLKPYINNQTHTETD